MNQSKVFLLFALLLYMGCNTKKDVSKSERRLNYLVKNDSFDFIIKRFGLMYSEDFQIDSNALVFYCKRSFDSSFLIHIKEEPDRIGGVYYLDPYFSNVSDSLFTLNYYSFFEGCIFNLDSNKWNTLRSKARELMKDTSFQKVEGIRDGREFGLLHNLTSIVDKGDHLNSFYELIENLFLRDIIERKKFR